MTRYLRQWARAAAAAGLVLLAVHGLGADPPARLKLVQTIALEGKAGRLDHLRDAKGLRLFVANLSNDSLDIVDLRAGKLVRQIPDQGKIQGVAYAPDLDRIFVGNGDVGQCNAFDGHDYSLLASFPLPDADNVRYDPAAARVYVAHAESYLSVIDAEALKLLATIKLPGSPEAFWMDSAGSRIFLNCPSPSQVVVIDTGKNEVAASYPLERAKANFPMALDMANKRVFVGCRTPPLVLVLDADTGQELGRSELGGDVDDLFYDAQRKRLYATCGEGFLAVLDERDATHFEIVERVPTAKQARTGLFDPETGRFYAILPAHDGKRPEVRVYQAQP